MRWMAELVNVSKRKPNYIGIAKWKPVNSNGIKSALYRLIKNQLVQDCDYSYICICC